MTDDKKMTVTVGDILNRMITIGSDRKAAEDFLEEMIEARVEAMDVSHEEAAIHMRNDLGYIAGYAPTQLDLRLWQSLKCIHPIFGTQMPTAPTAEDEAEGAARFLEQLANDDLPLDRYNKRKLRVVAQILRSLSEMGSQITKDIEDLGDQVEDLDERITETEP